MNRYPMVFRVLLVVLPLTLGACSAAGCEEEEPAGSSIDTDGDGVSDNEERAAGSDPNDFSSVPQNAPGSDFARRFAATEAFGDDPNDECNDGSTAIPCTDEFESCEAGAVGDLLAVKCGETVARDGTELSYAVQREAIVAGSLNVRWGCQAEPGPGTTSCIFDVLENGESVLGGACEFEGDLVDGALVLSVPSTCTEIPDDVSSRIEAADDVAGASTTAAAFLDEADQPVIVQIGTTTPIVTEDLAALL